MAEQIEACLALGITPTHLDSHFNAHAHPAVFPALTRLARRYGIGRVRWPAGELGASLSYAAADWRAVLSGSPVRGQSPSPLLAQLALAGTYGGLGLALRPLARGLDLPRAFGLLHSGMMAEDYVVWLLRRLPEGTTEMYFHPSLEPASSEPGRPTATHRSLTELQSLLSPRVRQVLREEGIELLSAR